MVNNLHLTEYQHITLKFNQIMYIILTIVMPTHAIFIGINRTFA
jgi:hypothetical protein